MKGYRYDPGQSSVSPIRDEVDLGNFIGYFRKKRDLASNEQERKLADRNWMMIFLGLNTALRFSDLRRLTAGKVKWNCISQRDQKTGKENKFALNPEVYREAEAYIKRNRLSDGDYLFRSRKGVNRPISREQGYNVMLEAKEGAGIHYQVGTHTLRKTYGYWFYKRTGDVVALQSILNHSSPAITLIYIGVTRSEVEAKRKGFLLK